MANSERSALKNALASTRMEGFIVTEQTEADCDRLLTKQISISDMVQEILARPTQIGKENSNA